MRGSNCYGWPYHQEVKDLCPNCAETYEQAKASEKDTLERAEKEISEATSFKTETGQEVRQSIWRAARRACYRAQVEAEEKASPKKTAELESEETISVTFTLRKKEIVRAIHNIEACADGESARELTFQICADIGAPILAEAISFIQAEDRSLPPTREQPSPEKN